MTLQMTDDLILESSHTKRIELTLPASLEFSCLVRQFSKEVFDRIGFTKQWSDRLKLVVDELFMNANRYGSKKDQSMIYIFFSYNLDEVIFQIEDEGRGANKISASKLRSIIAKNENEINDATKTCGRGLALISRLWTDELVIADGSRGGISVSFKKKISNDIPPALPLSLLSSQAHPDILTPSSAPMAAEHSAAKVIELMGEIDASNLEVKIKPVNEILSKMEEDSILVLDCKELNYINSTFISHLANWHNQLRGKNSQLVLRNVKRAIREILSLVGLNRIVYIES